MKLCSSGWAADFKSNLEPQTDHSQYQVELEGKGHSVDELGDGNAVLASLERDRPDLLVLDIYLLSKEGFEIGLRLKSKARLVKILVISGNPVTGYDACQTTIQFSVHETLTKPFDAVLSHPS